MRSFITQCSAAEMDNEQALAVFDRMPSRTTSERLHAARFLARNATSAHRDRLSKIRGAERNSWVRHVFDRTLQRLEAEMSVAPNFGATELTERAFSPSRLYEELRAQTIEETSALFLHELRPLIGILDMDASQEIDAYPTSRTKHAVNRIQSFLEAIDRLQQASVAPATKEFDITDLVIRVAENEAKRSRAILENPRHKIDEVTSLDLDMEQALAEPVVKLSPARRDPVVTTGDPTLVELSVANALRNAIEAVLALGEPNPDDVVLNWGLTDTDSWIVILDKGCGLPAGWDRLTEPGSSTKSKSEGHLGMGLPIAKRAIESMHGTLQLAPRSGGGVCCEIRWPRGGNTT